MRRVIAPFAALVLMATSCVGGGANERTVFVDYSYDQFNSIMLDYFPSEVTVAAGDTVVFKQVWTGEPHTVTGGTLVDKMMVKGQPWGQFFQAGDAVIATGDLPDPDKPEGTLADALRSVGRAKDKELSRDFFGAYDALVKTGVPIPARKRPGSTSFETFVKTIEEESNKYFEGIGLPWALDENEESGDYYATQNAGQPCYLTKGMPPKDSTKPCTKAQQTQPDFDGTASYYNSGLIRYEGPQGNTVQVKFTDDIKPGNYWFYCAVHGPDQSTEVNVLAKGSKIPPQSDVSRRAQREIAKFTKPMLKVFRDARDGKLDIDGETVRAPFGGLSPPVHGAINEFFPKTIQTKVGKKVTWKLMGWDHSVSFGVPKYFPILRFARNGNVSLNPQLDKPAGGAPAVPEGKEGEILRVDAGTYDGTGFFSSGLMSSEPYAEFSLRFSKRGTYKYACLLHPPMVGTVVVS